MFHHRETFIRPLPLCASITSLPRIEGRLFLHTVAKKKPVDMVLVFGQKGSFFALKLIKLILAIRLQQVLLDAIRLIVGGQSNGCPYPTAYRKGVSVMKALHSPSGSVHTGVTTDTDQNVSGTKRMI